MYHQGPLINNVIFQLAWLPAKSTHDTFQLGTLHVINWFSNGQQCVIQLWY